MRTSSTQPGRRTLSITGVLTTARDTFLADKTRFTLTALGMVIGTASLILVATIGLAGKQYLLDEIESIGSNWIYAEQENSGLHVFNPNDALSIEDMQAVQTQVKGIVAASPVLLPLIERVSMGGGKVRNLQVMGVYPEYKRVRNLRVHSGRFFDQVDAQDRNKVGVITSELARLLYGSEEAALGRQVEVRGLPFTIIGTFHESVDTFGQSELTDITILIPSSVFRYFQEPPTVKQIFFSASDPSSVAPITAEVRKVLRSRHRSQAAYNVGNLTQLLTVARRTSTALTIALLAISLVVLLVSGIGIMNIMLDTVKSRIREIGIRKAVGATNHEICFQFLFEAVFISLIGGVVGIVLGLAVPLSLRLFTSFYVPISGLATVIAIVSSSLVGVFFGTVPAIRAAQLDPVDSLHYE